MADIIRFHVPCKIEYTGMVEDFSELISNYLQVDQQERKKLAQSLRAVVNEVFINIVKHSNTSAVDEMVRFQFEMGLNFIEISIFDNGPGFEAESHYPPYPPYLFGKKYPLNKVLDGLVSFKILDPFTVSFIFEENPDPETDLEEQASILRDHGLGLSIITKIMDQVTYSYIGEGRFDWKLVKQITPNELPT
ncbi:MAG: ATP-binding protein [Caldisericaceae bacterium]|nr:ATP-binding protein [Caldisericaceae bacterium]